MNFVNPNVAVQQIFSHIGEFKNSNEIMKLLHYRLDAKLNSHRWKDSSTQPPVEVPDADVQLSMPPMSE